MNLFEAERFAELLSKLDRLTAETKNFNIPPRALLACADAADTINSEIIRMVKSPNTKPPETKKPIVEHVIGIGLGNGCSAGISRKGELLINHYNDDTRGQNQVNFGIRTQAEFDKILQYLTRLKIHLPE